MLLQPRRDKNENHVGELLRDPNHQKRTGKGSGKGACVLPSSLTFNLTQLRAQGQGKNGLGEKQLVKKIRDEVPGSEKPTPQKL